MIKKSAAEIKKILPEFDGGDAYIVSEEDILRMKERSPLSGLPGNTEIKRAVEDKFINGPPSAMMVYLDINSFKPYNDNYGFIKGDRVIKELAEIFSSSVRGFAGHIGGDDFAAVTDAGSFDSLAEIVVSFFEGRLEKFYDTLDFERKCIVTFDRAGRRSRYPLMGLTVVGFGKIRDFKSAAAVGEFASQLKAAAKLKAEKQTGSSIVYKYDGSSLTPLEDIISDESIPLKIRRGAIEALGSSGDFSYADILVGILGSNVDTFLKKSALYALGCLRLKETAPAIAGFLSNESAHLRMRAVEALGELGLARYSKEIAGLTGDKNYFVRKAAVLALGKIADPAFCELLKSRMNARDVRNEAFVSLAMLGDKDTLESLPLFINDDSVETDLRLRGLKIIKEAEDCPAGGLLLENLSAKSPMIRAECLDAAACLMRKGAVSLNGGRDLSDFIGDKSAAVRVALASFCGAEGGGASLKALKELVKDLSPAVRGRAIKELARFPGSEGDILFFLDDRSAFVRFSAAAALSETDMPGHVLNRAVEKLRLLLKDPSHEVAAAASNSILSIVRKRGRP